jgi:ParB-like nuclease domain
MRVNLESLEANPFRDFHVDPVDEANVAALVASIKDDQYWGGIVCRRHKGKKQIIAGEHRRRAAIKAGIVEADVFCGDFDDEAVVRIYARENATQRGNTSTALAGSVAAAIREISLRRLSTLEIKSEKLGGQNRDGVGQDAILNELRGIPGITDNTIRQQLANLKSSGNYDRIVSEVAAIVEEEHAVALEALRKAEEASAEAKRREEEARRRREEAEAAQRKAREERQRAEAEGRAAREAKARQEAKRKAEEAEARRQEAERQRKAAEADRLRAETARKAAVVKERLHAPAKQTRDRISETRSETKRDITFDLTGVQRWFKNASHVETFRRLATSEGVKPYLPVKQQAALAEKLTKSVPKGDELTSAFITKRFTEMLSGARFSQNKADAAEREEALRRLDWNDRAKNLQSEFARQAKGLQSAAEKLVDLQKQRPSGVTFLASSDFHDALDNAREALALIERRFKL